MINATRDLNLIEELNIMYLSFPLDLVVVLITRNNVYKKFRHIIFF